MHKRISPHGHYDHFSEEDINKVRKGNSIIVATKDLYNKIIELGFEKENIIIVEPNKTYRIDNINFSTIPAYNLNKQFHPKENGWVGYILELEAVKYYIAGDTDVTEENKKVECDVAFVPVGGTYTMTYKEAAELTNEIKPRIALPTHYGSIVGNKVDGAEFIKLLSDEIRGIILMK